jgi:hypothetical protein
VQEELMATTYFAKISKGDYTSLLGLPGNDFPPTFEAWELQQSAKKDEDLLKWHPNGKCLDVEIDFRDFVTHCKKTDSKYTTSALSRLASEKGMAMPSMNLG